MNALFGILTGLLFVSVGLSLAFGSVEYAKLYSLMAIASSLQELLHRKR